MHLYRESIVHILQFEEPAPWKHSSFPLSIEEIREMVRRKDDELPNDSVQMMTDRR